MALDRSAGMNEAHLFFMLDGSDEDQFAVVRYCGTEGLCQLYRFEIEAVCGNPDLDLEAVVGVGATLTISAGGDKRTIAGVVGRVERTGKTFEGGLYRIELFPTIWQLTHRYRCKIYQEKSCVDIITAVLTEAGIANDRIKTDKLSGTYAPREYCVQYRETDFNFICRLMEDEGIWWYIDQTEVGDVLVLADDVAAYAPINQPKLPFHPPTGMHTPEDYVSSFRLGYSVRPGSVALSDYSFEKPQLSLDAKGDNGLRAGFVISDFPGGYKDQSSGAKVAKTRAEEFKASRTMGVGQSNCARLAPGLTFDLEEHDADSLNGTYLLTQVSHQGKQATSDSFSGSNDGNATNDLTAHRPQPSWLYHEGAVGRDATAAAAVLGANPLEALTIPNLLDDEVPFGVTDAADSAVYQCRFTCIPADVSYRPPRVTARPVVRGAQTARVVGPSGEEIHTDEYGRVKVQFHWDLDGAYDEKASCWIRVCQGMAGGQYGVMFLPRIGQEVVVDFLEGNPDNPIIVGRVFNADNMPPYPLPSEKTKSCIKTNSSTGGGGTNEIRFEDLKDSEQLLINAQKDFHLQVGEEDRQNIGTTLHMTIGEEQRVKVGDSRSVEVGGKDAIKVADTRNVVVKGDVLEDFKANHGHKVAGQYYIKANQVVVESSSGVSFKVGGNFISITPVGIFIKGSIVGINSGGAALPATVTASPASPAAPKEPDTVTPGQDPNYSGQPRELPPIEEKPYEGHWISIDLKDEEGNARAGEYYEIVTPSGRIIQGTLDVNGFARVFVDEPGKCVISYPRLAATEWEQG